MQETMNKVVKARMKNCCRGLRYLQQKTVGYRQQNKKLKNEDTVNAEGEAEAIKLV
jgi:hypothetical protein